MQHLNKISKRDKLKKDNIILSSKMAELLKEQADLQLKTKRQEQEIQQYLQKQKNYEKQLSEKDREINLVKFEFSNPKRAMQELNRSWQQKVELLLIQQQRYESEIGEKNEKIDQLDKQLKELKAAQNLKEQYYKKEIENLMAQNEQLRQSVMRLEMEQLAEESQEDSVPSQDESHRPPTIQSSRRKMQRVYQHDIVPIGLEIAAKLKLHQFPFTKLDHMLYTKSSKGTVVLVDLIDLFMRTPFDLAQEQATQVARYLVEPEQEEWIYYDQGAQNDVVIAISILKNLIKPYELIAPEELERITGEVKQILKQYQGKLSDLLQLSGEYCSYQELKKALDYCDILLTPKQEEVLSIKIFEKFGTYRKLKHQSVFEYFK